MCPIALMTNSAVLREGRCDHSGSRGTIHTWCRWGYVVSWLPPRETPRPSARHRRREHSGTSKVAIDSLLAASEAFGLARLLPLATNATAPRFGCSKVDAVIGDCSEKATVILGGELDMAGPRHRRTHASMSAPSARSPTRRSRMSSWHELTPIASGEPCPLSARSNNYQWTGTQLLAGCRRCPRTRRRSAGCSPRPSS